jgi:hypothetical protein
MTKTKTELSKRELALDRQNQELRVALADVQRLIEQHIKASGVWVDPIPDGVLDNSYLGQAHRIAGEALKTPAAGS